MRTDQDRGHTCTETDCQQVPDSWVDTSDQKIDQQMTIGFPSGLQACNNCRVTFSRKWLESLEEVVNKDTDKEAHLPASVFIIADLATTYGIFCFSGLSSSRMRVINHNWSATKQRPHPQSIAEISRHSVLSGDRIRQCGTSSGSRHKDTDQCL